MGNQKDSSRAEYRDSSEHCWKMFCRLFMVSQLCCYNFTVKTITLKFCHQILTVYLPFYTRGWIFSQKSYDLGGKVWGNRNFAVNLKPNSVLTPSRPHPNFWLKIHPQAIVSALSKFYLTFPSDLNPAIKTKSFSILFQNGIITALPSLLLWIFSMPISCLADWAISAQKMSTGTVRKLCSGIGLFGPALCSLGLSLSGCSSFWVVIWLYLAVTFVGANHSGINVSKLFKNVKE